MRTSLPSLPKLVASQPNLQFVGELAKADDLVVLAQRECPDIVVLDITMPGRNAFEVLRELHAACPDVRVIMFSSQFTRDLVDLAARCGAWECISKLETSTRLTDAIDRVARGERTLQPSR